LICSLPEEPDSKRSGAGPDHATFHRRMVQSMLPEARVRPSGLNATLFTEAEWPIRVLTSLPLATSHSLIVLSTQPDAIVCPFGLNATLITLAEWPSKARISLPLAASHSLTVL